MTPVTELKGVGKEVATRLAKLDIESVEDVLFHLPFRYQDRTRIHRIADLRTGTEGALIGRVQSAQVYYRKRRTLTVKISDQSGGMQLRFFYFSSTQQKSFREGSKIYVYGECRLVGKALEMIHPEYRFIQDDEVPLEDSYKPIYPTTDGLNQKSFLKITNHALEWLASPEHQLEELLPPSLSDRLGELSLQESIEFIHRPPAGTDIEALAEGQHPARQRLVFEELLANALSLKRLRSEDYKRKAFSLQCQGTMFQNLLEELPFQLTTAQERVIEEVGADLEKPHPMMRLVQGDVGCGKTMIAIAAVLQAIECGYQAAVMAPTEILAEQHASNFREAMKSMDIKICLVSGRQKVREKKAILQYIRQGITQIIIGTHALFQESVEFRKLGLIVIDEKHRFGVRQRLLLKEKGKQQDCEPHQLIMTATPIPRSLAMMMYADLDYSIIDEMPPGRIPVQTVALPDKRRKEVMERVGKVCAQGAQAYWICTLIEESEVLQCRTAEESLRALREALPNLSLGLVHGQMDSAQKELAMRQFKNGEIQVLVATTVVEVGVDVPNASLMVIENVERLGLSQLHQLRGRVGRGKVQSTCVLLYKPPLSDKAGYRVNVLRKHNDGFEIAREDMRLRGPGEIMGTRQTGQMYFRVANLSRDGELLQKVNEVAGAFLEKYPQQSEKLIKRWLGSTAQYGEV